MKKKNLLITGRPGCGKTTLIKNIADKVSDKNPAGFYTLEIREKGRRVGFELVGLRGERAVLSHVRIKSPFRVGRYGVDLKGFEDFLEGLGLFSAETGVYIIDEIGKMESFSDKFCRIAKALLDSDTPLVATVSEKGGGFIEEVKKRPDVVIYRITPANRDEVLREVFQEIVSS
ncbi:MAG: nucleoside-triphosphatase THEP1 [bacterium]|nr:MAG: nucleoside-triphosphatase THEP1 [bacterium]